MEKQKEEIVSELYVLRAGLSVISGQADKVRDNDNQTKFLKSNMSDVDKQLQGLDIKLAEVKNDLDNGQFIYNDGVMHYDEKVKDEVKTKMKDYGVLLGIVWYTGFIVLALTVVSILSIANVLPSRMAPIFLCVDIALITGDIIYYAYHYKKFEKEVKEKLDGSMSNLLEQMSTAQKAIEEATKQRERLVKEKQENERYATGKIKELDAQSKGLVVQANSVYSALEKTFSKQLNPTDWKNIDLIIYYMQTGRADTIKESLQLADRQRQTDEIINTITQATNRICEEIHKGIAALGRTMVAGFNAVSEQLSAVSSQLAIQHSETMQALGSVQNSYAELLTAERLNSALQAKANVTNERLIKDVKQMQARLDSYSV